MDHRVSVQKEDFSVAQEYEALAQGSQAGAVVTFVGKVRDMNLGDNVVGLHLEHYPGMTENPCWRFAIWLRSVGLYNAFALFIASAICSAAIKSCWLVSAVRTAMLRLQRASSSWIT